MLTTSLKPKNTSFLIVTCFQQTTGVQIAMLCVRVLFAPGANGHSEDKKKNVGKQEKGDRVQKWCENRKVSHGQRERQKPNLD